MNAELFIDLIKAHPVLYDTTHKNYKEIQLKINIWSKSLRRLTMVNIYYIKNKKLL